MMMSRQEVKGEKVTALDAGQDEPSSLANDGQFKKKKRYPATGREAMDGWGLVCPSVCSDSPGC